MWGKGLIAVAAIGSIVVPVAVDGVMMARAHMGNPLWLPHAKLHCAMSFHAAIALGLASLVLLLARPTSDRLVMGVAAFTATAFWVGLIAAGFWPGTSYSFAGDPAVYVPPPYIIGIAFFPNVGAGIALTIAGWVGFAVTAVTAHSRSRAAG
jgi:hypothetical protein